MISEISGLPLKSYRLFTAIEVTKSTLAMAPMLAILFVTTRMYALLITDKQGAPQAWVQDGMYMATWSLLISFFASFAEGLLQEEAPRSDVETPRSGAETPRGAREPRDIKEFSKWITITLDILRYVTMVLLYGGIVTVIVGLFTMTPETANGRGSIPGLSDVVNSTPLGSAPPGPGSMTS